MKRWLFLGTVLAGIGAVAGFSAVSALDTPGPTVATVNVVVPKGRLGAVAEALRQGGVIGDGPSFRVFATALSWLGPLRAAELSFPAHASLGQVLLILRAGRPVQHKFTIPEGLTAARIGLLLARTAELDGTIELPREGAILPETYAFERGAKAGALLERGASAMKLELERAWQTRDPDLPLHSQEDLLVMASLVERETHLAIERPIVARVFYNRLRLGMRLQSDPTVVYGASGGIGELPGGLSRDELDQPGPYNSYVTVGLPPGPICNPGKASIEASVHPAKSDALYFVADGTGGHSFANSLVEHTRNVGRLRQEQRQFESK